MGISIGKKCYISLNAHIDVRRGEIVIGDNVSISSGTYILSHAGFVPVTEGNKTIIEDYVRIFVNAVVIPGVKIGKNSIIGAGSVVMKDIPPYSLAMGNPARVVQQLDKPSKENS